METQLINMLKSQKMQEVRMKSDMTDQETNEGITALEELQQTGSLPVSENDSIVVYEEKGEKKKSFFRKWKKLSKKKQKRIIGGSESAERNHQIGRAHV